MANVKGAKKRGREFWQAAVERMEGNENIRGLAKELGVDLRGLYRWRQKLEPVTREPRRLREAALSKEVERLKQLLADKTLEIDFFRGALHKIEARRQR